MKGLTPARIVPVLAIAALILSAVAVGWLTYGYETTRVSISTVNWQVIANGTSVGYVCDGSCIGSPIATTVGALVTVQLNLYGTTYVSGLTVTSVKAASGFVLLFVDPHLPVVIAQDSYATLNVTMEVPTSAGGYAFMGTVVASYG
jgi:hypothetical protein